MNGEFPWDERIGRSLGGGFIEFFNLEELDEEIRALDGLYVDSINNQLIEKEIPEEERDQISGFD